MNKKLNVAGFTVKTNLKAGDICTRGSISNPFTDEKLLCWIECYNNDDWLQLIPRTVEFEDC